MSVNYVIVCDDRSCGRRAPLCPELAGYRRAIRLDGWYHDPADGLDYCPTHNPLRLRARAAIRDALRAAGLPVPSAR